MPEISAADLRRLQALEKRLVRAQEERKALAAERRELRSAVTVNARRAREAEKRASELGAQLEAVLAENRALAARLDEIGGDLGRLRSAGEALRKELDGVQANLASSREALAKTTAELGTSEAERTRLEERVTIAEEQLAGKEITPVLPAKEVAKLVDGFVRELGTSLPGLAVRDGEVRLQVAFGKVGTRAGFVVPSAESPPDVRKNLHEVAIRFDRTVELPR